MSKKDVKLLLTIRKMALTGRNRVFTLFILTFLALALLVLSVHQFSLKWPKVNLDISEPIFKQRLVSDGDTYQLDLKTCKIPLVHKNSIALTKSFTKRLSPKLNKCDHVPDFSRLDENILSLTDSRVRNCCVREIQRPLNFQSDKFRYSQQCQEFNPQTRSMDVSQIEMMVVECDGTLKKKVDHWERQKEAGNERPPNIFVLVIDSTSRADLYRNLPKTTDFLLQQLGFVDFKGHHPLGEPTLVNAIPLLMGLRANEFWGSQKTYKKEHWDMAPFIWKTFNLIHYVTGYFEDIPMIGTFNYGGQRGFIQKPTDLYPRPLMVAHNKIYPFNKKSVCFGRRGIIKFLMDYHFETLARLPGTPSLLISWPCWPQHDIGQSLKLQEEVYLEFFQKISQNQNILENTIFIVMSDHGYFRETYAKTHEGLLERRNVPLLIRLSDKLRRENPELIANLLWNSEGITTHFDIHRTLFNLAKTFDPYGEVDEVNSVNPNRTDLLQKIPRRTCSEAIIPPTMCSCGLPVPIDDVTLMLGPQTKIEPLAINYSHFALHYNLP